MKIYNFLLYFCLPVFITAFLVIGCTKTPQPTKIDLIFRYDDYSATSDSDFSNELMSVLEQYQTPVIFGIIPNTEANNRYHDPAIIDDQLVMITEENVTFIKRGVETGLVDVAMHGYSHQNNNTEEASEFTNLDLSSQIERLSRGKAILEKNLGQQILIFVPPWNEYDHNTLIALDQLGFRIISARGRGVRSDQVNLNYYPFSCTLENIKSGITQARDEKREHVTMIVLFHEYEFIENSTEEGFITIQELSRLLRWINHQKDIRIIHMREANPNHLDLMYCP